MEQLLQMQGITKIYGNGILACDKVDFSVASGEIHALMGENGAGKSTLLKVLFGLERPDEGKILFEGKEVSINSPTDALALGIGMVHQHFMLVPSLTVAENLVLCNEPRRGLFIDQQKAIEETRKTAEKYNLPIDPTARISDLPVGLKQRVEILKALYRDARVLILDEPTAVLTPQETEELFRQLQFLREMNHTVIFVSHKIREIKELCDRITILRQGHQMGVYNVADVNAEDISRLMVGRNAVSAIDKKPAAPKQPVLRVENLTYGLKQNRLTLNDVSFAVRSGEILGIAGVEGNGQRELIELITGLRENEKGRVEIAGEDCTRLSVQKIRDTKMGHIPQDRLVYGLSTSASIADNLIATRNTDKAFKKGGLFDKKKINAFADNLIQEFEIKCDTRETPAGMLSGGNMQKVVVARELTGDLSLVIADQPTRGIDVGTARLIHERLLALRDGGTAVLLVSADLGEVMQLSDALIVMYGGEIVAYLPDVPNVTEDQLGRYMLGLERQDETILREVCHEQ